MSDPTSTSRAEAAATNSISEKLNAGIIGLALGAVATFLAMIYGGYRLDSQNAPGRDEAGQAPPAAMPDAGFADPEARGPGPMYNRRIRRQLASLVGKLDLCSREDLRLAIKFNAGQAKELATLLPQLEAAETMTEEEAQSYLEILQALLTGEQSNILDMIELPNPLDAALIGMPPPPPQESPFAHGTARNRLQALLGRLSADSADKDPKASR